jgi:alpha-D-ribose 1-methylphosphonate 5-triphosphate synthase subunit PhnH
MPAQTASEARTHATFDALLWALAHPGRIRQLEDMDNAFSAIAQCLLDLETSAHSTDARLEAALRAVGAKPAALENAEYIFAPMLEDSALLHRVRRGSPLSPETAATLVVGARLEGAERRVRLSGPGIDGALEVGVGGLPVDFWRVRAEVIAFPVGWDAFLVDGSRVIGLPRTTRALEVI